MSSSRRHPRIFALSETTLGLPPAQIAPYLVARLGESVARRLALTGAALDGAQAASVGLVDVLCETESQLRDQLETLLTSIERCAPRANAETKRLFRACKVETPETYIETAAKSFASALRGAEGKEGVAAFLEKRAPSWARPPA